jgi:hypothetical protein
VRKREKCGSKGGNKIATASMNMGMPLNTPTISMPYKMNQPRTKTPRYIDNFKNGQNAHTNSKGKQLTASKEVTTLLPARNGISAHPMSTPKFVDTTPENVWKLRARANSSPKTQVEEKADKEAKEISSVDHPIDMTPANTLRDNLTAPEAEGSDAIQETQKAKDAKRRAKKQQRAIEKAQVIPRQRKKGHNDGVSDNQGDYLKDKKAKMFTSERMFTSKRMFSPIMMFNGEGTPGQSKKDKGVSVEASKDARSGARGIQGPVDTVAGAIEEGIEAVRVGRTEKLDNNKDGNWRKSYSRNKQSGLERKKVNGSWRQ